MNISNFIPTLRASSEGKTESKMQILRSIITDQQEIIDKLILMNKNLREAMSDISFGDD